MKLVKSNNEGLKEATQVLNGGGVAVIPTDTVYGLAAHPNFPEAVKRLYTIKARTQNKPIALLASDEKGAEKFVGSDAAKLGAKYWPGALTIVAKGEGVRVPAHDWTRKLITACGGALRVTSANISGGKDTRDVESALKEVGLSADIVVDDGASKVGVASSVWKVNDDGSINVLREGPVK